MAFLSRYFSMGSTQTYSPLRTQAKTDIQEVKAEKQMIHFAIQQGSPKLEGVESFIPMIPEDTRFQRECTTC
ncbi:hypothetical protein JQC92_10540 [Shewanella sp. 202IG2-18]|uniref:hypothetical protein n=1 Tax=Parashewanella hymeniacidonis TaxID=2807618 RepID=UPI0019610BDB|nr:hypothetical protein [Parashewanella hymeniacidonis]MBM7072465.1 hypothetical protein [Parashewanella hymeniacidonis]